MYYNRLFDVETPQVDTEPGKPGRQCIAHGPGGGIGDKTRHVAKHRDSNHGIIGTSHAARKRECKQTHEQ